MHPPCTLLSQCRTARVTAHRARTRQYQASFAAVVATRPLPLHVQSTSSRPPVLSSSTSAATEPPLHAYPPELQMLRVSNVTEVAARLAADCCYATDVTARLAGNHSKSTDVTERVVLDQVQVPSRPAAVTSQPHLGSQAAPVSGVDVTILYASNKIAQEASRPPDMKGTYISQIIVPLLLVLLRRLRDPNNYSTLSIVCITEPCPPACAFLPRNHDEQAR